jgi:hypothetical protein
MVVRNNEYFNLDLVIGSHGWYRVGINQLIDQLIDSEIYQLINYIFKKRVHQKQVPRKRVPWK